MPKLSKSTLYSVISALGILVLIALFFVYPFFSKGIGTSLSIQSNSDSYFVKGLSDIESLSFKKDTPSISLLDKSLKLDLKYSSQNENKLDSSVITSKDSKDSKTSNSILYKDIVSGVDLKYTPLNNGFKEEVIINSIDSVKNSPDSTYSFTLNLSGFTTTSDENGYISSTLVSKSNPKDVYTIPPAFMMDKKGNRSDDVQTIIRKHSDTEGEYLVTLVPNREWLLSKDTQYPVSIDPTVVKGVAPVLAINFDENTGQYAYDSSGNANTATLGETTGAESSDPTWISSERCVDKNCLFFDGSDDKVTVAGNAVYSTNSTTISFWFRGAPYVSGDGWDVLIAKGDNSSKGWYITRNSTSNDITMRVDTTDSFNQYSKAITTSVFDNKWHYISYVIDNSGTITSYKDGNYANSSSFTPGTGVGDSSFDLSIANHVVSATFLKGFIDNLRIYSYARTAAQIKQDFISTSSIQTSVKYGSDTNKKLSDGLVGYWKMDEASWNGTTGEVKDSSGNENNGTSSTSLTLPGGKFGNGGDFNFSYVDSIPAYNNALDLTSSFTISAWVKPLGTDTGASVLAKWGGAGNQYRLVGSLNGDNIPYLYVSSNGTSNTNLSSTQALPVGQFSHIVGVYSGGATPFMKIYINGVDVSGTITGTIPQSLYSASMPLRIAADSDEVTYYSSIDEVRVYNRAFSPSEITALYNYAPGPIAYWKMDENTGTSANDSSGNSNTSTLTVAPRWVPGKFGGSLDFDGIDDYLTLSTPINFSTSTNWTVSGWFKRTGSASSIQGIIDNTYNNNRFGLHLQSTGLSWESGQPLYSRVSGPTLPTTKTFVTAVFSGTSGSWGVTWYLNGVFQSTTTSTATYTTPIINYLGGRGAGGGAVINMDDIKIYNYARTPSQIIEDMNGGHPVGGSPVGSQVGYWKFNEANGTTAYDQSINANNLTLSAAGWTLSGKYNSAYDGTTNRRLTRADDIDFDFSNGTDDFSISLWFNRGGAISNQEYLVDKHSTSDGYDIYMDSDGDIVCGIGDGTSLNEDTAGTTNANYDDTNWHHAVCVKTGTSSLKLYIDGKEVASDTSIAADADMSNSGKLIIGDTNETDGTDEWLGDIDELKIYRAALTPDQIKTEFSGGVTSKFGSLSTSTPGVGDNSAARSFCVPGDITTCTPPVFLLKLDEGNGTTTVFDTSGNNFSGSMQGTMLETDWVPGKNGKALHFDGSDDRLEVANNSLLDASSGMTVSAWIKLKGYNSSWAGMITEKKGNAAQGWSFFIRGASDATNYKKLTMNMDDGSTDDFVFADTALDLDKWYYVTFVYSDSANTTTFYLNGVKDGTRTVNASPSTNTIPLYIGGASLTETNGYLYDFNGVIDDVKIYNYARTPAQVAWDYNRGTPIAWYKFDEGSGTAINDWSPSANNGFNGNNGTFNLGSGGNTSSSTAWTNGASGVINSSLSFDGNDDYIGIGNTIPTLTEGSISIWFKRASGTATYQMLFTDAGSQFELCYLNNSLQFYIDNAYIETSRANNDGIWQHAVGTFSQTGNYKKLYLNGKEVASGSYTGDATATTRYIGSRAGILPFNGLIDDVRVFNYALTPQQVKDAYSNGSVSFR